VPFIRESGGDPPALAQAIAGGLGEGERQGLLADDGELHRDIEDVLVEGQDQEQLFLDLERPVAPRKILGCLRIGESRFAEGGFGG